ncbi:MAG: MarR family transcriptional regulator [Anaerolineae bacterium]|nr:MarR family transcriptional regulator [Anaerolineae bacterium]
MDTTLNFTQSLRSLTDTITHRSMRDWSRYMKASGLSMPQFFMLMHVRHREHCAISDLSQHLEITNAASSQLVDKLVQAKLLVRAEDPNDGRAKQISLSVAGEELVRKGISEHSRWVDEIAQALSKEERTKVAEALSLLNEASKRVEIRE